MGARRWWLLVGIAIGAAASALLRDALKPFGAAIRPLVKAAVKAGLILGDRAREKAGEVGEMFEDLVVEVQAERNMEVMREAAHVPDFGPPDSQPAPGD